MTGVVDHISDHVRQQAIGWLARIEADDLGAEEDAFIQWLTKDEAHQIAFAEIEHLRSDLSALDQMSDVEISQAIAARAVAGSSTTDSNSSWGVVAVVAILLLLLAGVFGDDVWRWFESDYMTVSGEQELVKLPDGSEVRLNTDSAIKFNYSARERRLELLRGEAYFQVTPQLKRPFIVTADDIEISALGTAFNIRLYEEGRVGVSVLQSAVRVVNTTEEQLPAKQLNEGQYIKVDRQKFNKIKSIDIEAVRGWHGGQLVVKSQPLSKVLAELSRYHSASVIPWDDELAALKVSGIFKTGDLLGALAQLEEDFALASTRITPLLIIVTKRDG